MALNIVLYFRCYLYHIDCTYYQFLTSTPMYTFTTGTFFTAVQFLVPTSNLIFTHYVTIVATVTYVST